MNKVMAIAPLIHKCNLYIYFLLQALIGIKVFMYMYTYYWHKLQHIRQSKPNADTGGWETAFSTLHCILLYPGLKLYDQE